MTKALVVLAAGIGSRYGGLKQMDPVGPGGEFIIDYAVFDALRAGFQRIVFVIRRDIAADFRATIGTRVERRADVRYAFQELTSVPAGFAPPAGRTKPWGTAHAILSAAERVDGPFAVINADDFYGAQSYRILGDYLDETRDKPSLYAMVAFRLKSTLSEHGHVSRGICSVTPGGDLAGVDELTRITVSGGRIECEGRILSGDEPASMNLWGFKPSFFGVLRAGFESFLRERGGDVKSEYYISTAVDDAIRTGNASVRVLSTPCGWMGVTYAQEKPGVVASIRERIRAGEYPERLWE